MLPLAHVVAAAVALAGPSPPADCPPGEWIRSETAAWVRRVVATFVGE